MTYLIFVSIILIIITPSMKILTVNFFGDTYKGRDEAPVKMKRRMERKKKEKTLLSLFVFSLFLYDLWIATAK